MKKIFTFAAAMLTSLSMMAQTTFTGTELKTNPTTKDGVTVTLADKISVSDQQIWKNGSTGVKADVMQVGNSANQNFDVYYVEIASSTTISAVRLKAVHNQSGATTTYNFPVVSWAGETAAAEFDSVTVITAPGKEATVEPGFLDVNLCEDAHVVRIYRTIRVNAAHNAFASSNYTTLGDGKTIYIAEIEVETGAAPTESYTVTFDGNGHGTPASASLTETAPGAGVVLPDVEPATGWDFQGWAATADATEATLAVGKTFKPKSDTTLYAVYTVHINKYTVTYFDGTTELGSEEVVEGETPADAAKYENKARSTFDGWFTDAELTTPADLTAGITADMSVYGKWTAAPFTASTSINIEQGVLDNSTKWDIKSALTAAHIEYASIDALDSLNDDPKKTNRNEAFLGLKLKTQGAYVEVALNAGDVLRVKFGNVAADVKVNGATVAKADLAAPYEYTAAAQEYVRIETTTGGTVVLKQIMINEEIANVVLPGNNKDVTLATLTLDGVAIEGFSAAKKEYTITLEEGATLPVVAATAANAEATVGAITQATTLPGDATFTVTAADGTTTATYTIHFVLPRVIEYLSAPYESEMNAEFVLPNWLAGCEVMHNYAGSDTIVAGYDVIRFGETDTISMYIESCDSVIVDLSATGGRTIAIAVNGEEKANSGSFSKNTIKTLAAYIHSEEQVIVNIYGVDVTGGTTISRIKVTEYNDMPMGIDNVEAAKAIKVIENGQIVIIKNGVRYNAVGAKL